MLILSRKIGERIMIDGGITITVVDIDRGKIRLGITCPKEVSIMREELLPLRKSRDDAPPPQPAAAPPDGTTP